MTDIAAIINNLILTEGLFSYLFLIVIVILVSLPMFKWKMLSVPMFAISVLIGIFYLTNNLGWHSLIMFLNSIFVVVYTAKELN